MGVLRVSLLARELITDLHANNLAFRGKELVDGETELANQEKRLVEKQLQELATTCKRIEELHAAQAVEAQKVWDFLG
jgi:hypothetical protein